MDDAARVDGGQRRRGLHADPRDPFRRQRSLGQDQIEAPRLQVLHDEPAVHGVEDRDQVRMVHLCRDLGLTPELLAVGRAHRAVRAFERDRPLELRVERGPDDSPGTGTFRVFEPIAPVDQIPRTHAPQLSDFTPSPP
ncbi:hypothetical protein JOD27_006058 [Lentzea nigeriaca]|nr:hypothetical protein [Lentzea nigeriaca]MBM7862225.1 hypothetical protein [Lentzea nigeriaca]